MTIDILVIDITVKYQLISIRSFQLIEYDLSIIGFPIIDFHLLCRPGKILAKRKSISRKSNIGLYSESLLTLHSHSHELIIIMIYLTDPFTWLFPLSCTQVGCKWNSSVSGS